MWFMFHLWNHNVAGKRSLEDVIGIVGHQLRALGHEVVWDPTNDLQLADDKKTWTYDLKFADASSGYNVIVEGFTPWSISVLRDAYADGKRFICLASEEPTDKGFNHGLDREMRMRQETFGEAAKYFDAIWHLVPGDRVTRWFAQHAPTHPVELGFAPTLVRQETCHSPPYDFGFYGSLSKRRRKLLQRLADISGKPNAVRLVADFQTQVQRDRAMQQAKVILQVRKFKKMGLVSSSRCNTALSIGRPVIAEEHDLELSKPWDEVVSFASGTTQFFQAALAAVDRWRELHALQFQVFAEKLNPDWCVGRAMRATGTDRLPVLTRAA